MKKCTTCLVFQPLDEFRQRIRKNKNGTHKEERLASCKGCEAHASFERHIQRKLSGELKKLKAEGFNSFSEKLEAQEKGS